MATFIGIVSQKGGVGKSMVSRLIATEYSRVGWKTLIADMDTSQKTSTEWSDRRKKADINPVVESKSFLSVEDVLAVGNTYDIIIFDGAPHATFITKRIADVSDLIVLPTGNSIDDLNPQIRLAYELQENGIDSDKIVFMLTRVGKSESEIRDVLSYIKQTKFSTFANPIPEKLAFRHALMEGKTLTETKYKSLTEKCEKAIQNVVDKVSQLTL